MPGTFSIFSETLVLDIRRQRERNLHEDIRNADFEDILECGKGEFLDELIAEYSFDLPELDFDNQEGVKRTKRNREVLVVRIPFEGDQQQLRWKPQSSRVARYECYIEDGYLCFDVPRNVGNLQGNIQDRLDAIRYNYQNLRSDLEEFNERFQNLGSLEREYDTRREEAEEYQAELDELDFPIHDE